MILITVLLISWWITLFVYMYWKKNKSKYTNIHLYLLTDLKKYRYYKRNNFK